MKKFSIKSLGCKQNQLEGQIIQDELLSLGYEFTPKIKEADFFILNSCSVTSHADSEVHYILNKIKRENPNIKTVLTGCCAQTYKQHKDFDYQTNIDLVLGNIEKMDIKNYLENLFSDKKEFFIKNIFEVKDFQNKFLINPQSTRVSIKIQDGCNNRCSYCIIPYARGNSRSNPIENVIKQINLAVEKGFKEIVLTGIHIGQWGLEFNKTLLDLLIEIEKTKIPRYRLGSLYVNELDDKTIDFLKNSKKFCPHFHLSLQSMCDKTLKEMNRNYNTKTVKEVVQKLHKSFDLPFLGCDIIVGFPNETEADFKTTFDNLKELNLTSIHVFPYSKREGTPAFSMENQVQDSIKTQRVKALTDLSKELYKNFIEQNKNKKAEILIEKKSPKTGLYSATTKNYIRIFFKSEDNNLRHTIKTVDLKDYL